MKRFILTALVLASVLLVFSCGSGKVAGVPDFVLNPPIADDVIYGVGYGNQSKLALSKTVAETNARADIARQIETTIQASVTDYAQEAGVDDGTQVISFVESVTREITDTKLSGAKPVKFEQDNDGGIWVLMQLDKAELRAAAEEAFVRNEDAAFAEFKAAQALDRLDYQLENNPTVSEPVR
ncbi:MAG: LPP20 family lipoprotein [Spirochaetales bacterium]|uniref:LPP20 family lipoprotein n=1 Tax=Candidatus Thalassospirochaeta sargassi TaxID=3119039 RepID=A0AAJ1MN57_9SPIO|nr:LPP20 family lipoprotein [Spirochaetales bacterium]